MPVSAVGTINFPCGLGPFQQALHPLLATSGPLNLLRLRLIQSSLMGATVSSTSAFDRCLYTIQYTVKSIENIYQIIITYQKLKSEKDWFGRAT